MYGFKCEVLPKSRILPKSEILKEETDHKPFTEVHVNRCVMTGLKISS